MLSNHHGCQVTKVSKAKLCIFEVIMGHSEATATHTLASPADSHKQQSELTNWQALMQAVSSTYCSQVFSRRPGE